MRKSGHEAAYTPTREEIIAACAEIRAGWGRLRWQQQPVNADVPAEFANYESPLPRESIIIIDHEDIEESD